MSWDCVVALGSPKTPALKMSHEFDEAPEFSSP